MTFHAASTRTTIRRAAYWLAWFACLLVALPVHAHVGSKDVYEQVTAGPYTLFITIRTPVVIPGVASIEVRTSGGPVRSIRITPTPMTGEAAKHPPGSDTMQPSASDPAFFTGALWIMAPGSWQVHFELDGAAGAAKTSVPLAAMPLSILPMQRPMAVTLALLGLLLVAGIAGIVAAAVRESRLAPGLTPGLGRGRQALKAGATAVAFSLLVVYGGYKWWNVEATAYAGGLYQPMRLTPVLDGNTLDLRISGKERGPSNHDFLPDHGHLMHLYAIREPGMDAAFHLHPALVAPGDLRMTLPAMPAGDYRLYGDVVHANGFPETLTASLTIPPGVEPMPLAPEDASAAPPALDQGELGAQYRLPDGYSMAWERPTALTANTAYAFRFRLLDAAGRPAADTRPYLGMAGHAAFVKTDGSVFAHTHPEGSAAMQAMMLANGDSSEMPMAGTDETTTIPPSVSFPYGFPSPGRYRIFVQMKHGNTVETGVFDTEVR